MKKAMDLINKNEIIENSEFLKKFPGLYKILSKTLGIDSFNKLYERNKHLQGKEFIDAVFVDLNLKISLIEDTVSPISSDKPFIIISNHPFGMLDGLILMRILFEKRPDFKIFGNYLLNKVEPLNDYIIPLDPINLNSKVNFLGFKEGVKSIKKGIPLAIFPAGEVSTYQDKFGIVEDSKWHDSVIKLLEAFPKVDIIPVYFSGSNSDTFHLLGQLNSKVRTILLPHELLNKKSAEIAVTVGKPIDRKSYEKLDSINKKSQFLRSKVYALETNLEIDTFFGTKKQFGFIKKKQKQIIDPISTEELVAEINQLEKNNFKVLEKSNIQVFITNARAIPNILKEIGRLREITFREVGEGTSREFDLDQYDLIYEHLFAWDKEKQCIIGAYRLGKGNYILQHYGRKGFYLSELFKLRSDFKFYLNQSLELGRSFVIKEYQLKPIPLFIMWQAILVYITSNQNIKYIIGPVSISNKFSKISQSLLVAFIKKHHYDKNMAELVKCKKPFKTKLSKINTEVVLESFSGDLKQVEKFIEDIEPSNIKIPVLLRKYLKQNAKIIGFNIDPKFNDCLDGFMILDIEKLPSDTIELLK